MIPTDFNPTDIVVQRDGTMMISDWADGQRPKRGRGRIYHIAYAGKPSSGGDSQNRPDAVRDRLHAIWAMARSAEPGTIDELLKLAASDSDPSVRAQAIRAVADLSDPVLVKHRLDAGPGDAQLAGRLAALAKGQESRVLLEIVVALGRLRWANAAEWLRQNLTQPDAPLAHAAMQTLRRSGNWPAILKLLDLPGSDPVRAIALRAVAERYEPTVVDGLIERLGTEKEAARGANTRTP